MVRAVRAACDQFKILFSFTISIFLRSFILFHPKEHYGGYEYPGVLKEKKQLHFCNQPSNGHKDYRLPLFEPCCLDLSYHSMEYLWHLNVSFSKFTWFTNINYYQVIIKRNIHGQFIRLNIDDQVNFFPCFFPIVKSTK